MQTQDQTLATPQLQPGDPFLLIPPKYRGKACFGPGELRDVLGIGRKEYERLKACGDLPAPLSASAKNKAQRWSIAAIAGFLAGTAETPAEKN